MEKLTPLCRKDQKRIVWLRSFRSGTKWFLKLAKQRGDKLGTQKNYALAIERFCEYIKMNPDEIIKEYIAAITVNVNNGVTEWNDNLDLFVPWVIEQYGLSRSRAKAHFAGVKSFFDNNVAIKLTAKTPEAYSQEKLPTTIDDIRDKILLHADIHETFNVLFLKDCGVSQAEALRFNVGDIEDLGNGFGYMRVFRKKEGVDYETFIGPNAMTAMQQYFEYRKREGENVTYESPLLMKKNKLGERLTCNLISYQLQALGKKAGVELSSHRLRKTFETYLAIGKVHPMILKYWMGHKIKRGRDVEARYILPPKPEQMKLYMEAYQYIDVTPKADETKLFLADVKTRMGVLPLQQRERFVKEVTTAYSSRRTAIYNDKRIKELLEESNITQGGMTFGGPQFTEITEDQLLSYLKAGWRITHNLQNGRVIVEKR